MDKSKPMSFALAAIDYFGRQHEQTIAGFNKELKALSDADRAEIRTLLGHEGYHLTPEVKRD